jgi:hypothetical protein
MLDIDMARKLKQAGLTWVPKLLDYFILPDRHMDDHIFVISDLLVTVDMLQNNKIISFQGSPEWALDYLITTEAVWLPREDQLRRALKAALFALDAEQPISIISHKARAVCRITLQDEDQIFEADNVSQAYANALLYLLVGREE